MKIGILGSFILGILKLTGALSISWLIVFSPLIFMLGISFLIALALACYCIGTNQEPDEFIEKVKSSRAFRNYKK